MTYFRKEGSWCISEIKDNNNKNSYIYVETLVSKKIIDLYAGSAYKRKKKYTCVN